ncbi:hypothetical protein C0991_010552 [Blastosporella zonata]|nr:hypothetical protein C0991_010552 [Blastosporella zonata]
MEATTLEKQLDEFQLIRSSLLSDEKIIFLDEADVWTHLTREHEDPTTIGLIGFKKPGTSARFRLDIDASLVSFVVEVPALYEGRIAQPIPPPIITVKGDQITRAEQDRWQEIIQTQLEQIEDTECVKHPLPKLYYLR